MAKKKKTKTIVKQAFKEVEGEDIPRKQKIAIALSKSRKRGARIKGREKATKERLESYIEEHEKPKWLNNLGFYPAYASVEASKAQLNAMNKISGF